MLQNSTGEGLGPLSTPLPTQESPLCSKHMGARGTGLKLGLGQTRKRARKTKGVCVHRAAGSRGCAMHQRNLPPKPPSLHHHTGLAVNWLTQGGCRGAGRGSKFQPKARATTSFQVRHTGRGPTKGMGCPLSHPPRQKRVGQDPVPSTPSLPERRPGGCREERSMVQGAGRCEGTAVGKWGDTLGQI